MDPKSGKMINKSLKDETNQVMNNLKTILMEVGFDFNIIKSTIYLTDMDNFGEVNEIYGSFFDGKNVPARVTVEVSRHQKMQK